MAWPCMKVVFVFSWKGGVLSETIFSDTKFLNFQLGHICACLIPKNENNDGYQRGLGMNPIIFVFLNSLDGLGLA